MWFLKNAEGHTQLEYKYCYYCCYYCYVIILNVLLSIIVIILYQNMYVYKIYQYIYIIIYIMHTYIYIYPCIIFFWMKFVGESLGRICRRKIPQLWRLSRLPRLIPAKKYQVPRIYLETKKGETNFLGACRFWFEPF